MNETIELTKTGTLAATLAVSQFQASLRQAHVQLQDILRMIAEEAKGPINGQIVEPVIEKGQVIRLQLAEAKSGKQA